MNTTPKGLLFTLLAASVVIAGLELRDYDHTLPKVTGSGIAAPVEESDGYMRRRTEDALRARMKDPGSVEFRNVRISGRGGARTVCGEANAKNGFGGYSGFERFLGVGAVVVLRSDMAAGEFEKMWALKC